MPCFLLEICGFHGVKGNSMKSSAIRNAAGLTVILGLLCPAPFASASSSSPSLTADAIASGVITNAHGKADTSGEVYVFAFPDQSVLIGAPAGKQIPLTLVGYARTNAQGRYAVNARPANLMTTNGRHRYVNLEVVAVSGGKAAAADYSVAPAGTAWRAEGGTDSAPALSFNFATRTATPPPVAAMTGASPAAMSRIPITPTAVTAALERLRKATHFASAAMQVSSGPHVIPPPCLVKAEGIYYNKPEHFMTTATFGGKIPETVTEGTDNSSTHTLGVALEAETKNGLKWSVNGTGSITDSSTHSVSVTYSGPRTIYNRVNYRQYYHNCGGYYERRPYSFYDLLTSAGTASMTWLFASCGPHDAGTTWISGNATSATIGGGVSLGPINVSAQSGFGTSVQLKFTYHVAGEVCGNNKEGPAHSSRVEADQGSTG